MTHFIDGRVMLLTKPIIGPLASREVNNERVCEPIPYPNATIYS